MKSREAGNTDFPLDADWIDYEAAGCDGPESLRRRTMDVLAMVDCRTTSTVSA